MILEIDPGGLKLVRRVVDDLIARRAGTSEPSMVHLPKGAEKHDLLMRAFSAELMVSGYLGQEWQIDYTGPNGFDVAPNIEVRNTQPGRALYIKHRELVPGPYEKPPHTRYVLTWTGDDPTKIALVGWLTLEQAIEDARTHEVGDKVYGYLVPAENLWPIERLKNALART